MKIVANKSNGGFLVDLTREEMANILGFHNTQEIDKSNGNPLTDGAEIDISKVYQAYRDLDVKSLRDQVAKLQGVITTLLSEVAALPVPEVVPAVPPKRKVTITTQDGVDDRTQTQRLIDELGRLAGGSNQYIPAPYNPPLISQDDNSIPWNDHHRTSGEIYFDGAGGSLYRRVDPNDHQ